MIFIFNYFKVGNVNKMKFFHPSSPRTLFSMNPRDFYNFLLLTKNNNIRYMQVVHRDIHRVYFNQITVLTAILFCWVVPVCLCMVPPLILDHTCKESCRLLSFNLILIVNFKMFIKT